MARSHGRTAVAVIDLTEGGEVRDLWKMRREFTQQALKYALSHYDNEADAAHALGLTCRGLVSMRRKYGVTS